MIALRKKASAATDMLILQLIQKGYPMFYSHFTGLVTLLVCS